MMTCSHEPLAVKHITNEDGKEIHLIIHSGIMDDTSMATKVLLAVLEFEIYSNKGENKYKIFIECDDACCSVRKSGGGTFFTINEVLDYLVPFRRSAKN
jgi:hypothetical protein